MPALVLYYARFVAGVAIMVVVALATGHWLWGLYAAFAVQLVSFPFMALARDW